MTDWSKIAQHPSVLNYFNDGQVDLNSTDPPPPRVQNGYQVLIDTCPSEMVTVITTVAPYAMQRTNVGSDSTEGLAYLLPQAANGFMQFRPLVNGKSPLQATKWSHPGYVTAASVAGNTDKKEGDGYTFIVADPYEHIFRTAGNGIFGFAVPPGATLQVAFNLVQVAVTQIAPAAVMTPLPTSFVIGNAATEDNGFQRVDWAGCILAGLQIPVALYNNNVKKLERM